MVVGFLALVGVNLFGLHLSGHSVHVDMGDGFDKLILSCFHKAEELEGVPYRWTTDSSTIRVQGFATAEHAVLTLKVGGLPPSVPSPRAVLARVDGAEWTTFFVTSQPRHYALLLPSTALQDGSLAVDLSTEPFTVPPDKRQLGIRIDRVGLVWFDAWVLPSWGMLLVQSLLVLTVVVLAWRLAVPWWGLLTIAGCVMLALGGMTSQSLLIAASWQNRLLVSSIAVLLLFLGINPALHHILPTGHARAEVRWLWVITLLALAIRLVAILYPPFDSHDWYIHRRRMIDFLNGAFILYDQPAEFSKKLTIVPPAPYLLYAPFTLLTDKTYVAMQGVYTFLDGVAILCAGVLVRLMGGSVRASRFAAIMLALFPLNFTALWWGFGPQVIGQSLLLMLVVFVAGRPFQNRLIWLSAGLILCLILLSHVGAGILGGCCVAGYTALVWWYQRRENPHWKGWGLLLLASGVLLFVLLYVDVAAMQFQGVTSNKRLSWDEGDIFRYWWSLESLYSSFAPLGIALPLVSVIFLVHQSRVPHRWLVNAWLASAELFFVIDLVSGLQVRYAYFVVPMIVTGLAMLLDRLVMRSRTGWLLAVALIGIVGVAGLRLWYDGTILWIQPSLRGLTH